jgi:hypothetical protein
VAAEGEDKMGIGKDNVPVFIFPHESLIINVEKIQTCCVTSKHDLLILLDGHELTYQGWALEEMGTTAQKMVDKIKRILQKVCE